MMDVRILNYKPNQWSFQHLEPCFMVDKYWNDSRQCKSFLKINLTLYWGMTTWTNTWIRVWLVHNNIQ